MKAVVIANQKGGSGKTTTTVNLAAALGERKKKVLVIDLDAQANTSQWFGVMEEDRGLLEVFTGNMKLTDLVRETGVPGVDLVPSSQWLMGADKALAAEVGAETILARKIQSLKNGGWDFVLMDCGPSLGTLPVNALVAASGVLIPATAHVLTLSGVTQLMETVEVVRERLNPALAVLGVVVCRLDRRNRHSQEVEEHLREQYGRLVFKTVVRENIRVAESVSFAQPITQYDTRSHGAEDFRALAGEFLRRSNRG